MNFQTKSHRDARSRRPSARLFFSNEIGPDSVDDSDVVTLRDKRNPVFCQNE